MGNMDKKQVEKFDADYNKIYSQDGWTKEDIEMMKDLQKLMYYIEVRCAMKEGGEYPGERYMDDMSYDDRSYDSRSYDNYDRGSGYYGGYNRGSGHMYMDRSGRMMPYGRNISVGRTSGRRYYDGEKENSVNELRQMMNMEQDPDKRAMLDNAIRMLESK